MVKAIITLVVEVKDEKEANKALSVVRDGLYEFPINRHKGSAFLYVEERYDWLDETRRKEKVEEVEQRLRLARELHQASARSLSTDPSATLDLTAVLQHAALGIKYLMENAGHHPTADFWQEIQNKYDLLRAKIENHEIRHLHHLNHDESDDG